jgi:GH35 family endo-1,4-beta-xylanase
VQIAFENARQLAPKTSLIYNDYQNDFPGPVRDMNVELVSDLQKRGLIDGIGLQMHLSWQSKPSEAMAESMRIFQEMGLFVTITECDVNMRGAPGSEAERQTVQAGLFKWVVESALDAGCRSIFLANVIDWPEWAEDSTLWTDSGEPRASFYAVREVLRNA